MPKFGQGIYVFFQRKLQRDRDLVKSLISLLFLRGVLILAEAPMDPFRNYLCCFFI